MSLTCLNCSVKFKDADNQREHYKSDWHRYNLKRRVAELPPITAEEFQKRVLQQRKVDEQAKQEITLYCTACRKQFATDKSYDNHLNSKKHRENAERLEKDSQLIDGKDVPMKTVQVKNMNDAKESIADADDIEIEEVDSDEWDEDTENPIANNDCIFCTHHSENLVDNVKHMSIAHSFFVPDAEYIIDLEGLLLYLGEKVTRGEYRMTSIYPDEVIILKLILVSFF